MTQALATITAHAEFRPEQVALIKRTVARGTSDDELAMFLQVAQRTGLDPFTKQIYAIMRWDAKANRNVMSIQVGIDGMRAVADRTGCYAPGAETVYVYKDDRLFKATAYVKKLSGGAWHEIAEAAHFSEYAQGSPMWSKLPHVMLAKCAEARALRRAFPMQLSGVYAREEMDQAQADGIEEAVVEPVEPRRAPLALASPPPSDLETKLEASIEVAKAKKEVKLDSDFEAMNKRLTAVWPGDENKERRKGWMADAMRYQGAPGKLYQAFTRLDPESKAHVFAQLAKLEASSNDDLPADLGGAHLPEDGRPGPGWGDDNRMPRPDSAAGEKPRGAVTRADGRVSMGAAKTGETADRVVGEDDK